MKMSEYGVYLNGKKHFAPEKDYQKANIVTSCLAVYLMECFPNISEDITHYNSPKAFYKDHPEIPKFKIVHEGTLAFELEATTIRTNLPKESFTTRWMDEVFYSMKIGTPSSLLSSRIFFEIMEYGRQMNNDLSNFPALFPEDSLVELCSEGYLPDDIAPNEIISKILGIDYVPFTTTKPYAPIEDGYVIYLKQEDKTIKVSEELKEKLTIKDMNNLTIVNEEVYLGDTKLISLMPNVRGFYLNGSQDLIHVL